MKATTLSMSSVLLSCSLLLAAFGPVSAPAATTLETVVVTGASPIGFVGRSSLALDSSQKPHISFVDEPNLTVMYGVKSGGSWTFEAIAAQGYDSIYGDPNLITCIALDSAGDPHIAFWDPEPNVLKYASKSGGIWTIETADAVPNNGRAADLVIDAADHPHLAYYDQTNYDLRYATKSGGVWTTETVDGPEITGYYLKIAVDAAGNPRISYSSYDDGTLKYAAKSGGVWTIETIPIGPTISAVPVQSDIAIDALGMPHIAYWPPAAPPPGTRRLMLATKSGGTWSIQTVDPGALLTGAPSIRLDATGNPSIAYFDSGLNRNLKYAARSGGTWTSSVIDAPGSVGQNPNLVLDAAGNAHILYADATNLAFKYASVESSVGYISGAVTADCPTAGSPLLGVTVDAFAVGSVTLAAEAVTDASGNYALTVPSAGDYNVVVVTPLSYTASPQEQVVAVAGGQTTSLNFSLQCSPPSGDVRAVGFWKQQVGVATGGKGVAQVDGETLCGYLDLIATHFNSNAVNPVVVYVPPASGDCADKLDVAASLLNLKGKVAMRDRARQQFLALLLNVASARLGTMTVISRDGATASQAITYCDNLVDNPTGDCERAKTIAEGINDGKLVAAGMIPLTTAQIAYRRALPLQTFRVTPPGSGTRMFSFTLGQRGPIRLNVFDITGRLVAKVTDGELEEGSHNIAWHGETARGARAGSGVYFARLETAYGSQTLKMVQVH